MGLEAEDAIEEPALDDMEEPAGDDMADKARALVAAVEDLVTAAGIGISVTDTAEEEPAMDDMEAPAADLEVAADDMVDTEETDEEEVEMAEGTSNLDELVAEITQRVMDRLNQ